MFSEPFQAIDPRLLDVRESAFSEYPHASFVKKGVVIPLGAAGAFDGARTFMASAAVLDGRVYLYYSGHDGSNERTGLAISRDGIHFVKKGVVIPLGAAGAFDDVHAYAPAAVAVDERVYLYYTGNDGSNYRIGLAISRDGIHFVKKGVVIPLGAAGAFDDAYIYAPAAVAVDERVYLYYSGNDGSNYRIGLAIARDGIHFVKKGVVIPLGAAGAFDDAHIYGPSAVVLNGRVYLYYSGNDGSNWRIGLAISKDGL